MKTPGEWSLIWANHEINGWTWTGLVAGIRDEMRCGTGCIGDDCTCCGDARTEWTAEPRLLMPPVNSEDCP